MKPSIGTHYEVWGKRGRYDISKPRKAKTLDEARRAAKKFDYAEIREEDGHLVEVYGGSGQNPKRRRSMKRRRAKKIRFRGHLWTRAKFAKKYGKRKAAKCFSKRTRKYSRRRRAKNFFFFTHRDRRGMRRAKKRSIKAPRYARGIRRRRRNGAYPYFTVIKGGGKRKKYRRPKLRLVKGGRRYRPAANCRR